MIKTSDQTTTRSGHRRLIAIIGRPNVGKSTLFNRLAERKKAIIIDQSGVTRDRNYAPGHWYDLPFVIVDTGGFEPAATEEIMIQMREQTTLAMEEADIIIFLMDGRAGLMAADLELADLLRRLAKPVFYVVNKVDGPNSEDAVPDFFRLGVAKIYSISSQHGRGIDELMDGVAEYLAPATDGDDREDERVRIAIIGKPNVGKSSLVNRILGYARTIVNPVPGTTVDAIDTPFSLGDKNYLLVDTAGIRRKSRISLQLEKYSVMQAIKTMERSHVALLVIDAQEGMTEQDAKIAGLAYESGRAAVVVVNKWDLIENDNYTVGRYVEAIRNKIKFMDYAPIVFISALSGQRVTKIFDQVDLVYGQYTKRISTAEVNRGMTEILSRHAPPRSLGREQSIAYVTQAAIKPPTFVFFVRDPQGIHFSYERFLVNQIRETFSFDQVPVRVIFRKKGK